MPDIAEVARKAHDTGFEQGSIATINAVLAYLERTGPISADALYAAWNSGQVAELSAEPAAPPKAEADPADAGQPKITREQARTSGYTGDVCTNCQSLQVRRNGSCLVCESCGQTTGCS